MYETKKTFLVWVGGIADEFNNEADAKDCAAKWTFEGYDDVQIEKIEWQDSTE